MSLLRPRDHAAFDANRAAHELGATKRNRRPLWVLGGLGAAMGVALWLEPYLWWEKKEEPRAKEVQTAFDVAALTDFHHPEPEEAPPVIKEIPVPVPEEKIVQVDKPRLVQVNPPAPAPSFRIEKVRIGQQIAFRPQTELQPQYMLDGRRPIEAWGCAIRPGQNIIQATFVDDIRWDYGGPIMANVTEDVLSPEALARGQRRVLIPAGATLIGTADASKLARGMDLAAGPIWTEVTFTDTNGMPRSVNLFDAQGAGASGINAIGGEVDARWGPIIAAAAFFTVLDVIGNIDIQIGDDGDTVNTNIGGSAAASIGRDVVRSMLDWKPRIFTPKGTQIIVKPIRAVKVC